MIFRRKRWIIKKTTCELLSVTDNADVFCNFFRSCKTWVTPCNDDLDIVLYQESYNRFITLFPIKRNDI